MQSQSKDLLPSNKAGIALIIVVLIVSGIIFGSKIDLKKPLKELNNVELVVERKTQDNLKNGDGDNDGLPDWLEEFYKTDPKNPDTDGDGTKDGDEIGLDRDPSVAGPNDPLLTQEDLIDKTVNMDSFKDGTLTQKMSIDLFTKYANLKKQGLLKQEDATKLVNEIAQDTAKQASLRDKYTFENLNISESSNETVEIYGDRLAQSVISFLTRLDGYKNLKDKAYIAKISDEYEAFAQELTQIRVPGVVKEPHLALVNYMYKTSVFYDSLNNSDKDPLTSLVVLNQYKQIELTDGKLYTILGEYFKNNDIIFTTDTTATFWKQFQN